jgi:hypothetical protein
MAVCNRLRLNKMPMGTRAVIAMMDENMSTILNPESAPNE